MIPDEIKNLFKDKKVCIVAGGAISGYAGEVIDKTYDVVVRMNNIHFIYPYSEQLILHYGERCDVLLREHHCMWGMMNEMGDGNYADTLAKIGVKDVIIWDGVGSSEEMLGRLSKVSDGRFNCHILKNDSGVYPFLDKKLDALPTTGLMAIALACMCEPKEIGLYGFTFYYDYVDDSIYNEGKFPKLPNDGIHVSHKHRKELELFRDYFYWLYPITMDSEMLRFIREKTKGTRGTIPPDM